MSLFPVAVASRADPTVLQFWRLAITRSWVRSRPIQFEWVLWQSDDGACASARLELHQILPRVESDFVSIRVLQTVSVVSLCEAQCIVWID